MGEMARIATPITHSSKSLPPPLLCLPLFHHRTIISKARPVVEEAIKGSCGSSVFPRSVLNVADLGCSSGTNTLSAVSEILDSIYEFCRRTNRRAPQFRVFLNDLPGNDFNAVFKSLPDFHEKLNKEKGDIFGPCFVFGAPGSFYGRLFPTDSMHFIHSASSVHWLSKVPEGLETNGHNIYISKTSPSSVLKAYKEQFHSDFSLFLSLRSNEVVSGGCMVLTLVGRSIEDPTSEDFCSLWDLLADSLLDLVAKGLVEEAAVNSLNLPYYAPYKGEIEGIIEKDGHFHIDRTEIFGVDWDPSDEREDGGSGFVLEKHRRSGENVANCIRAVTEPMLMRHFGEAIIEPLFARYAERVAQHLSVEKPQHINITISMTKKWPESQKRGE